MTAITRAPENTNILQPTKYLLVFDRIPTAQYFCQTANLPGVSLGEATYVTPFRDLPIAGNKLNYNSFDVSFTLDEELIGWKELYNWMFSIAAPTGFDDRNRLSSQQNNGKFQRQTSYSDATLTILSALNNPLIRVYFHNLYPVSLSDIEFDTKSSADEILTGTASFAFEYHEFMPT